MLRSLFTDEELAVIFSEQRYVAEMLAVEAALATVEARLGVIPAASGKVIAERAASLRPDLGLIGSGLASDGVPVIELVRQLREHLVDVVREQTDAPLDWEALKDEAAHFGSAQAFIDRVLGEASST